MTPPSARLADASASQNGISAIHQAPPTATFKDLNPSNFPSQESRRRNAEQRAAALRADPLIGDVEPNRVFLGYNTGGNV